MQKLLKLMLQLRSEAKGLQRAASDSTLKKRCLTLAGHIEDLQGLWHTSQQNGAQDFDTGRMCGLIRGFWCQILSTSYMCDGDEYLLNCSNKFIEQQARLIAVSLYGIPHCKNNRDTKAQMLEIAEQMVKACDAVRSEALHIRRFVPAKVQVESEYAPPPALHLSASRPARYKLRLVKDS